MELADLPTPSLVVDKGRVAVNTAAMRTRLAGHGVNLRPHAKTAKSVEVARLALGDGTGGLTISTLAEANYFLAHGLSDMTYAVCISPGKLDAIADLMRRGADIKIITDSVDVGNAIARHGAPFQVLIEIDCGEHRTGVAADSAELTAIADAVTAMTGGAEIKGVLTHAGHSYLSRNGEEAAEIAEVERLAAVAAAARLRDAGCETPIISVGSTPTATHARSMQGVTEARPGVYVFQDLFQAGIGSCGLDDLALSVLASVISRHPERGTVMIDAGGLALSKDRSTGAFDGEDDCGFGMICDMSGTPMAGLRIAGVHQEHGEIKVTDRAVFEQLSVGAKVRVLPNHACMTAAAYGVYHIVEGGVEVTETWERCNGW